MTRVPCGCCEGRIHHEPVWNAPGRDAIAYRIGRQTDFFEAMIARLSSRDHPALAKLTTREWSDLSIALLDAWATLADIVSFYQERLANEGYLRTATERRAVLELANLIGYRPRPGVAASTHLAFTMEDGYAGELAAGTRAQSVPGPGQLPQTFETVEKLDARALFNVLRPRMKAPQLITLDSVLQIPRVYFEGTDTRLNPNDLLLFYFGQGPGRQVVRFVGDVVPDAEAKRTTVSLIPVLEAVGRTFGKLYREFDDEPLSLDKEIEIPRARLLLDIALGMSPAELVLVWEDTEDEELEEFPEPIREAMKQPAPPSAREISTFDLGDIAARLATERATAMAARSELPQATSERVARLVTSLRRDLTKNLYAAWAKAPAVPAPAEAVQAVYALRTISALFGYNAPEKAVRPGVFSEWPLADDEAASTLFLENTVPGVTAGSHAVIRKALVVSEDGDLPENVLSGSSLIYRVVRSTANRARAAYGISGKVTQATVDDWWQPDQDEAAGMTILRNTTVYCQSEELALADEPLTGPIGACAGEGGEHDFIFLEQLYEGLEPGRTVIVTGQRVYRDGSVVRPLNVAGAEVATIAAVEQGVMSDRPGDTVHSTIHLERPLRYCYQRDTVRIAANVAEATHGESRAEVLGSGDAALPNQRFALKQGPLTYVPADNPDGITSTLQARVDDILWHEAAWVGVLDPSAHGFTMRTTDDFKTMLTFGDGVQGARLPTGVENIRAAYRVGIGHEGNVDADSISLLSVRPLGLKAVINPLPATGGAGPDSRDAVRRRAPETVTALRRLVSVPDYADFARTFTGIAGADARRLSIHGRDTVHVTVAALEDAPIDSDSALYRRLLLALREYGDPLQQVALASRELTLLVLSARIRIHPDYEWAIVERHVREALLARFGFEQRRLAQDAMLSDAIVTMQRCKGVVYVDVDTWGGVPEFSGTGQTRHRSTLGEITQALDAITGVAAGGRISIGHAIAMNDGSVQAAGLAYFTPGLPETIALTEITDAR